jgi:hypothetical protein
MRQQESLLSKGVLLIACGKYYGKYAVNLATSIKYFNSVNIHLCCDKEAYEQLDIALFDSIDICFENSIQDWCKVKTEINTYSPFDKTIYLDVDAIATKDISPMFDLLKDCSVYIPVVGEDCIWAKNEVASKHIGIEVKLKHVQTSLIYFDNSKESKEFFKSLKSFYKKPLKKESYNYLWGKKELHPDELYYSITLAFLKMYSEIKTPIFFADRRENISVILNDYFLLSHFGAYTTTKLYAFDLYDKLSKKYFGGRERMKSKLLYKNKFITQK